MTSGVISFKNRIQGSSSRNRLGHVASNYPALDLPSTVKTRSAQTRPPERALDASCSPSRARSGRSHDRVLRRLPSLIPRDFHLAPLAYTSSGCRGSRRYARMRCPLRLPKDGMEQNRQALDVLCSVDAAAAVAVSRWQDEHISASNDGYNGSRRKILGAWATKSIATCGRENYITKVLENILFHGRMIARSVVPVSWSTKCHAHGNIHCCCSMSQHLDTLPLSVKTDETFG